MNSLRSRIIPKLKTNSLRILNQNRVHNVRRRISTTVTSAKMPVSHNLIQENIKIKTFSTAGSSSSTETISDFSQLDAITYDKVCTETLNALCDYFEEIIEDAADVKGTDVAYGDGVLTVNFGSGLGIYVINRQSPNKQIWLSSPTSGPKRYDFVGTKIADNGKWIYKHTGETLHELLQNEIGKILKNQKIDFLKLPYGGES